MEPEFKSETIENLFEAAPIESRCGRRTEETLQKRVRLGLMTNWNYLPSTRCIGEFEGFAFFDGVHIQIVPVHRTTAWNIHKELRKRFHQFFVDTKIHEARSSLKRIFRYIIEASPRIEAYFNRDNPMKPEVDFEPLPETPWQNKKKTRLEKLLEKDAIKQRRIAARSRIGSDGIYTGKKIPGYAELELEDILGSTVSQMPTSV